MGWGFEPGELLEDSLMWPENVRPTIYGHWPAWQITIEHSIDPADGEELLQTMEPGMKFTVGGNCRNKKCGG